MFARSHQSRLSYWVYILTNKPHGTLYVGVTNSLDRRVWQHRNREGAPDSFVHRYGLNRLVYFEDFSDIRDAIAREKQLKGWLRAKKSRSSSRPIHSGKIWRLAGIRMSKWILRFAQNDKR